MDAQNTTSLLSDVGVLLLSPTTPSSPFFMTRLAESLKSATDPNPYMILGITISLCTNFIQSMGLAIQRKSHVLNENYPLERRKGSCQRPLWLVGFVTYLVANIIGSIFSIGYLPILILAPLGAIGLVFNAFFARVLLGDPFTRQTIFGTVFILIGALFMGLFGVVDERAHSLDDLIELWTKPAFMVYFSIVEALVISSLVVTHFAERKLNQAQRGIIKESDPVFRGWRMAKVRQMIGISYGVNSGMISSQSLLFAKSGVELLFLTIVEGKNQFDRPLTWILVLFLAVTAILQLFYLNKGLRLCDTILLIPLSFCTFNVSCLFNGLVYYNQWGRLYWWQITLVIFGVLCIILGVLVLSWRSAGPTGPEEEFLGDDADEESYSPNSGDDVEMGPGEGSSSGARRYVDDDDDDDNFDDLDDQDPILPDEKTKLLSARKKRPWRSSRGNSRVDEDFYGI